MSDQAVLFELEDDSALLLPAEQVQKRYTAEQADKIERLREAVLMLVPCWPVERIASQLHLSTRTVRTLALGSSEKVAGFSREYGESLLRLSARWLALARMKEDEASPKDLAVMAGIVMQNARDLVAIGQLDGAKETKEEQDHLAAATALRRLMDQAAPAEASSVDSQSTESPLKESDLRQISQFGAADGAGEDPAGRASDPPPVGNEHHLPGGGFEPGSPGSVPMPPNSEGIQPKADPAAAVPSAEKAGAP